MMRPAMSPPAESRALVTEIGLAPVAAAGRLRALPGLVLLDSSLVDGGAAGRYSYLTADPFLVVRSNGRRVELGDHTGRRVLDATPWDVVQRLLAHYRQQPLPGLPPFQGGAVGYFGYDLGRSLERLPAMAADDLGLPELWVGFYDWVLSHDHLTGRSWLVTTGLPTTRSAHERRDRILALLARQPGNVRHAALPSAPRLRSNVGRMRYLEAVHQAKAYILAGDIYQVNLSHRLEGRWPGDPWSLYLRLREVSPVPYGAYLALGDVTVLSASPERFLRLDGRCVETRPIKGTRPRGHTPQADRAFAAELRASEKERAENLMIVDLLRNDLGRVCRIGSVHVPALFSLEGYANVWQLVSTVTGELQPECDAVDLLRACFPGGSVTGCPKIRAMEIIDELEPVRRGIYCGAIGYLGFAGAMDTSIVIRTLVLSGDRLHLHVGGAVVADSEPEAEYAETIVKARTGLSALGAALEEW